MSQIDQDLTTALRRARTQAMNFALVLKGPEDGTLIVSRHPITPKTIAEARPDLHGCHVYKGRCVGKEHDHLVFESATEPPAILAKILRALISRQTGLLLHVEARKGSDHSDVEVHGEAAAHADVKPDDAVAVLLKETVRKRLVDLAGRINLARGEAPIAQRLHTLLAAIKAFVEKHDFAHASQGLDLLEQLVASHGQADASA
jgi:hypothetical protein